MQNISFHAHHSPWGAYTSFVLGRLGKGGGFALNDVKAPGNDVYVGYKRDGELVRMLPFSPLTNRRDEAAFGLEQSTVDDWRNGIRLFPEGEISREYTAATDSWHAGGLELKIYTPYGPVLEMPGTDPEEFRKHCVPAVLASLTLDNASSAEPAFMFFGLKGLKRLLGDASPRLLGGAMARRMGFGCLREEGVEEHIGYGLLAGLVAGKIPLQRLGDEVIVTTAVAPGQKRTIFMALGTYQNGLVTTGLDCRFAYTDYFSCLEDALAYLLDRKEFCLEAARRRDEEYAAAGLSENRRLLLAHAVHSYHASTELLVDTAGEPVWAVNEGEYQMINTLDLTVDQLFFEMRYHPWTVRNALDLFLRRYSYTAEIKTADGRVLPGGISFCHDMGVANMFSPPGMSAYEAEYGSGCFSYMTMEELLNWTICGAVYAVHTPDHAWLAARVEAFRACLASLGQRDTDKDGILDADSVKAAGREITTYDSLDPSLARARNNLYMAVKTWAAAVCLQRVFAMAGRHDEQEECEAFAARTAAGIVRKYREAEGYLPALFDVDEPAMIVPAIEALVYPYFIGDGDAVSRNGRYAGLIEVLQSHCVTVLQKGRCLHDSGGWKITSRNVNTWMSKIFLAQFAADKILALALDSAEADAAHASWQFEGCAELCAVDQVNCDTGEAIGSRLYPRLVTAIVWLER